MTPSTILGALAALSLAAAPAFAAPDGGLCLHRHEAENLVVVMLPTLIDAAGAACATTLPLDAVLLPSSGLAAHYRGEAEAALPDTRAAFERMADKAVAKLLAEPGTRKFLSEAVARKLGEEIKTSSCASLDRLADGLSSLPAHDVARVMVALFELSGKSIEKLPVKLCPARDPR